MWVCLAPRKEIASIQEEKKKVLIVVDAVNELEGPPLCGLGWLPRRSGIVVTDPRWSQLQGPNVKTIYGPQALRDHGAVGRAAFIFRGSDFI